MTDAPINLNKARKARDRTATQRQAEANAEKFGRTLTEREGEQARAALLRARLDAHLREEP